MKKFKLLLVLAVVITLVSTVAFAASPNITLNVPEYSGSGSLKVTLSIDKTASIEFYSQLVYDSEVWQYKEALKADGTTLWSTDDINNFGTAGTVDFGIINAFDVEAGKPFITMVFEPLNSAAAEGTGFYLEYASTADDDCDFTATSTNPAKVTVKPSTISPVANTTITAGSVNYTDVVNFIGSVTGSGTKLSFDLFENNVKHGDTYSVNLADYTTGGITVDGGTVSFKVAVIGAPETGVTMGNITLGD